MIGVLIAAAVFAFGANAWISTDLAGVQASRAALEATRRKVALTRQVLTKLPALRRNAAHVPGARTVATWAPADDARVMSQLAARSGVTLLTLAPAAGNADSEAVRTTHLTFKSDFLHLMVFLRGLSDLPVLVVPEELVAKSSAGGLLVSATLRAFTDLHPVTAAPELAVDDDMEADDEDVVFYDPFLRDAQADGDTSGSGLFRLAGLLRDRVRGLALLETADGAATVERGQLVGIDRVTDIDAVSITLMSRLGTRTLSLAEAS
jgi:hypothetical protein